MKTFRNDLLNTAFLPRDLKEDTVFMLLGSGTATLMFFLAQVLASRSLGPKAFGIYGLVLYSASLISGLFDSGLSITMATFVSEKEAQNENNKIGDVIRAGITIETFLAAICLAIYLSFNQYITDRFFQGLSILTLFCVAIIIVQGFYGLLVGTLIGYRRLKEVSGLRIIQQFSFLVLMLTAIYLGSFTFTSCLLIHLLSLILALFMTGVVLFQSLAKNKQTQGAAEIQPENNTGCVKTIIHFAIPIATAVTASAWLQASGPAILNFLTDNQPGKQLGILILILTICKFFDNGTKVVSRAVFPYLVNWNTSGKQENTLHVLKLMTTGITVGYSLMVILSIVGGTHFVTLIFGIQYLDTVRFLPLGLLVTGIISLAHFYRESIYAFKKPASFLVINIAGILIFFAVIFFGHYYLSAGRSQIWTILISMGIGNGIILLGSKLFFRAQLIK